MKKSKSDRRGTFWASVAATGARAIWIDLGHDTSLKFEPIDSIWKYSAEMDFYLWCGRSYGSTKIVESESLRKWMGSTEEFDVLERRHFCATGTLGQHLNEGARIPTTATSRIPRFLADPVTNPKRLVIGVFPPKSVVRWQTLSSAFSYACLPSNDVIDDFLTESKEHVLVSCVNIALQQQGVIGFAWRDNQLVTGIAFMGHVEMIEVIKNRLQKKEFAMSANSPTPLFWD